MAALSPARRERLVVTVCVPPIWHRVLTYPRPSRPGRRVSTVCVPPPCDCHRPPRPRRRVAVPAGQPRPRQVAVRVPPRGQGLPSACLPIPAPSGEPTTPPTSAPGVPTLSTVIPAKAGIHVPPLVREGHRGATHRQPAPSPGHSCTLAPPPRHYGRIRLPPPGPPPVTALPPPLELAPGEGRGGGYTHPLNQVQPAIQVPPHPRPCSTAKTGLHRYHPSRAPIRLRHCGKSRNPPVRPPTR